MNKESVFKIHPEKFSNNHFLINDYKYDFLDFIDENINFNNYYNYLNNLNKYKINNLYYFIKLKFYKLNIKYNFKENISIQDFNNELKNLINNNKMIGIIIVNLITNYYH